jgi:putative NADPH-quinone reductase
MHNAEPKHAKHVIGFMGSPRSKGNTDILVDEILAGAREAGATVEKVVLEELTINPCKACYACRTDGQCVQDDDMQDIYAKMQASHVWVIGTPVYWWGPSAQLKAFVDRWFAKAGDKQRKERTFKNRRIILAVPMGDTDPETGRHVVGMFRDALDYIGAELFDVILAPGAYDAGEVRGLTGIMEKARAAGRAAVTK